MSVERCAHYFCAVSKLKILHQTESKPVRFVWMELDAWDCHLLAIRLILEIPIDKVYCAILRSWSSFFITKHLKIVLKDIDNFIWRKRAFYSVRHPINKSFKLLIEISFFSPWPNLVDKVVGIILATIIDHSVEVSLWAKSLHLVGSLKADFKNLFISWWQIALVTRVL